MSNYQKTEYLEETLRILYYQLPSRDFIGTYMNHIKERDKEIERLNNELELQNIEMGREIERLKELWKTDVESSKEILYEKEQEIEKLQSIIKEAREYIENVYPNSEKLHSMFLCEDYISNYGAIELLEILRGDKE